MSPLRRGHGSRVSPVHNGLTMKTGAAQTASTSRWVALALVAIAGCSAPHAAGHRPAPVPVPGAGAGAVHADPGLEPFVRIVGPSGRDTTFASMLGKLAEADVVFLGETHLDEVTHRVELAVLEALTEARDGRVVLAMEMFATDAQPVLDRYLAGRIDEATFLESAPPWKNYWTGYRALIEYAREQKLPVVGSNIPVGLRRKISSGKQEAFDALTPEERQWVPPHLHANRREYWQRFRRAVAGHQGSSGDAPDLQSFLYSSQSLWDNTMGWSCARALERYPGAAVLHVNGGFHSKYGQGTVDQLRRRRPGVAIATVSIIPASDLSTVDTRDAGRAADFLVFTEGRGRGLQEGFHAVHTSREIRYRNWVPAAATMANPSPLLIWLPAEGLRAADAAAYWRAALGDEAAVVAIEPPYLQLEDDLHLGGRWYWTETFHDDVGAAAQALERIIPYVTKYFPVDASRVVVGGAGMGATVVVVAALLSDRLAVDAIALEPRQTSKLIEVSLPDLAPMTKSLTVLVDASGRERWEATCRGYETAGLDASVAIVEADGYRDAEKLIRRALGLDAIPPRRALVDLLPSTDSPLSRHWVRLHVRLGSAPPLGSVSTADLGDATAIPIPAGPFGGTTLVVVPATAPRKDRQAWQELAQSGAMQEAHGRFHRLMVAFEDEAPRLGDVLGDLHKKGRNNVLIVPAMFCAGPGYMRELRKDAAGYAPRMTLTWLPGLGGSLPAVGR